MTTSVLWSRKKELATGFRYEETSRLSSILRQKCSCGNCCSKADASVQEILEAVAARSAIEQNFHDVKEVHGAGQQQVRNYYANIAVFHVTLWWHTLIELWAWSKPQEELTDRSASPWDKEARRPSHADRRNALRRQCLANEFSRHGITGEIARKLQTLLNRVAKLVV